MRDKYTDLIRVGKVSSINEKNCTVQVAYEDRHDSVSGDLHILVPMTLKNQAYYMPDIGERVLCIFDPSAPTKGCIVGSYYADTRMPPVGNRNKVYTFFEDNTLIEYDKENHKLTIHIPQAGSSEERSVEIITESDIVINTQGNLNVKTAKDVDIRSAQSATLEAVTNINITAAQSVNIQAETDVNINATGKAVIQASEIHLNP